MYIRKNKREREVIKEYHNQGWEVLTKGWPDLLLYKNGQVKIIEVKRLSTHPGKKNGLSSHQRRTIQILAELGLDVSIRYVK